MTDGHYIAGKKILISIHMIKRIVLSYLLCLPLLSIAQDHKATVTSQFLQYYDHIRKKEFEKATDYMNPAFFNLVPKDQLITAMASVFNTPGLEFETDEATIKAVGPVVKKEKMQYVVIEYASVLRMRFSGELAASANPDAMKANFERQYGKENVSYNDSTKFYSINAQKKAVANSEDGKKWTFVVLEPRQYAMLKTFIPEEFLK
jgi:hypothetical protein